MLYPKDREIRIGRTEERLLIEWNWKRRNGWLALVAAPIFGLLMYLVSLEPTSSGAPRDPSNILGLWIMAILFVGGLVTLGIVTLLNKTILEASRGQVTCRTSPITFTKGNVIPLVEVKQFFLRLPRTREFSGFLYVMDGESFCRLLCSNMPSTIAAHQVCHELQDFYGLEDLPVYGQTNLRHQPGPRKTKP